jgi:hypothetical protein
VACLGGASLSGWYGILVSGGGKFLSGSVYFDGNCNVSGNNVTGGSGGQYATSGVTGTYGQNSDGTFTITLNFAGQSTPQTYMVGVSESGNKARGLESDGSLEANIDIESQLTTLTAGYSTASLSGSYAASCSGGSMTELNYLTFDGNGNLSGVDDLNYNGSVDKKAISGSYSVNGDGTFSGSLVGSYSFNGVIERGVSEIQYTYNQSGTGGVMACVGKQAGSQTANLTGYYGIVVGRPPQQVWGGKYLSGSVYFDGAGGLSSTNLNGGSGFTYGNMTATGSYIVNSDNTISITMNVAGESTPETYVVAVSESGNEAAGIETDNTAVATVDLQSQLQLPGTPYNLASLHGTYSASCGGYEVDLNYVSFDGNGHIFAGVDAYDDGSFGDNPYTGTYTVNSDGTFTGNFDGPIYDVFTLTGVLENGVAEMEYTYYQSGFGGVVSCIGESTFGPVGANPVVATPSFNPAPGAYSSAQSVTLSDTTPGAVIYYTANGVAPSIFSQVYSGPIAVSATTTIQAIAVASGYSNSSIAAGTYFSQAPASGQSQTISFPSIPAQTHPAGPVTLTAAASSGLPVSYAVIAGQASINGNVVTIPNAGSVVVQANQAGNAQYAPATPVSQTITVSQASTALVLTASNNPSSLGQALTFVATIMPQNGGQVTGTVSFANGSTSLGVASVSGNVATLSTSALSIGTHSISAVYSGDNNFIGSTAAPMPEVVNKAVTSASVTSSANPANAGQNVRFTVTVSSSGPTPTGSVQFLKGTTVLGTVKLKSGTASYSTKTLPAGSNMISANYFGDFNNSGSNSAPVNEFVLAATTTALTSSPNPSVYGQPVMLSATVTSGSGSPADGETVTFKQGSSILGTGTLVGGVATFSTTTLGVGTKAVTAVYSGDSGFVGSTSKTYSQVIGKAATTTTVTSSQEPSSVGQPVTFTATVTPQFSGIPTGSVTFSDGVKVLKTVALNNSTASFTTTNLSHGNHNITAAYKGSNTEFNPSSGSLTQSVN